MAKHLAEGNNPDSGKPRILPGASALGSKFKIDPGASVPRKPPVKKKKFTNPAGIKSQEQLDKEMRRKMFRRDI